MTSSARTKPVVVCLVAKNCGVEHRVIIVSNYISSDDDASSASSMDSKSSIRSFADAVTGSNKSGTIIQITNLKNTLKS